MQCSIFALVMITWGLISWMTKHKTQCVYMMRVTGLPLYTSAAAVYLWPAGGDHSCQECLPCNVKRSPHYHRSKGQPDHVVPERSAKPANNQEKSQNFYFNYQPFNWRVHLRSLKRILPPLLHLHSNQGLQKWFLLFLSAPPEILPFVS